MASGTSTQRRRGRSSPHSVWNRVRRSAFARTSFATPRSVVVLRRCRFDNDSSLQKRGPSLCLDPEYLKGRRRCPDDSTFILLGGGCPIGRGSPPQRPLGVTAMRWRVWRGRDGRGPMGWHFCAPAGRRSLPALPWLRLLAPTVRSSAFRIEATVSSEQVMAVALDSGELATPIAGRSLEGGRLPPSTIPARSTTNASSAAAKWARDHGQGRGRSLSTTG